MGNQNESSSIKSLDAKKPPMYTPSSPINLCEGAQAPPENEDSASTNTAAAASAMYLFPAVMNAYYQWSLLKSFKLCGVSEGQQLYAVEVHTGYSGKGPLGTRPGQLLHNGTSIKDPILAAAGDESMMAALAYTFNPESVILMPPISGEAPANDLVTERMRAHISEGHVAFRFSIEVGQDKKMQRGRFEWRKLEKSEEHEARAGGFRLVRLAPPTPSQPAASSTGPKSDHASSLPSHATGGDEVVAILAWSRVFTDIEHIFTLRLLGSGESGVLGERWRLMVVMTALRLWQLRLNGRTIKGVVAAGQKIWGKQVDG